MGKRDAAEDAETKTRKASLSAADLLQKKSLVEKTRRNISSKVRTRKRHLHSLRHKAVRPFVAGLKDDYYWLSIVEIILSFPRPGKYTPGAIPRLFFLNQPRYATGFPFPTAPSIPCRAISGSDERESKSD